MSSSNNTIVLQLNYLGLLSYKISDLLQMVRAGTLPSQGFLKQEDISLPAFLETTTGRLYAQGT